MTVVAQHVHRPLRASRLRWRGPACSPPIPYVEDSMAPRTRITMGPGVPRPASARRSSASPTRPVTHPGTPPSSARSTRRKWKKCASPLKLKHLRRQPRRPGQATDAAGNVERAGAKRRFKVIPAPRLAIGATAARSDRTRAMIAVVRNRLRLRPRRRQLRHRRRPPRAARDLDRSGRVSCARPAGPRSPPTTTCRSSPGCCCGDAPAAAARRSRRATR